VLDAEQHHVCVGQDMVPVLPLGALACGIQAGGQAQGMCLTEHSCCEGGLQQWLPSTACDATTTGLQVGCNTAGTDSNSEVGSDGVFSVKVLHPLPLRSTLRSNVRCKPTVQKEWVRWTCELDGSLRDVMLIDPACSWSSLEG
jgi:hypothetical protein